MTVATKIAGAQAAWDSDAEFRADALAVHNALIAAGGLVQTADTGQTNFTANTRATSVGAGGYTVYRFDDAHQGSYPLFIRIDWYQAVVGRLGFGITIGTGTNGSGTITGVIRAIRQTSSSSAGSGAGLCDNYVSVGDGYLYLIMGVISGAAGNQVACGYIIERSTDEEGVVHPEEGIVVFNQETNSRSFSVHPTGFTTMGPANTGSPLNAGVNYPFWDDQAGADVGLMPSSYMMRSKLRFHRLAFMRPGRIGYGVSFDAEHLGATRKMLSLEQNYYHNSSSSGWTTTNDCGSFVIPWN